jgi:predicted nucleotidyltransferase
MDLADPTRAVTGTLDGPVLAVLANAGRPLTVGEVAAISVRGSEIGIRRSLARLIEQGLVRATEMGRNRVHELNRDHVAAPIAHLLAGLRLELWRRFRQTLQSWKPPPLYACVFGSAARGDGDSDSDIDLLLVHPPFPGENYPRKKSHSIPDKPLGFATELTAVPLTERQVSKWRRQVDDLRVVVHGWTGNPLQVVEMSAFEWDDHRRRATDLFREIHRDAVELKGPSTFAHGN